MQKPKIIFKQYCKKNSMRYTPEREIIIDEIYCKDTHFNIDNLFLRIRNKYPKIKLAKGSIYRTIPHLVRSGLVRESLADEGHICYEHALGHDHHDHLKCLGCGRVFEFYEDYIDKAQQALCKKSKFKMVSHTHVLYGYCSKCHKKNKKDK